MQWTHEQRRAIETRDTNILLSAAAGSGKTTVLVERVLELIQSGAGQVDRMLIVTFTRAASADMRAKLSRELGKRAAEGDERCRSQQLLLERASISTLHSFCSEFLRTHFESAGVDPAFRVLDDAETRRITDEALDQAIEEAYGEPTPQLSQLDYARGPRNVRAMAESLLRVLDERPGPRAWLENVCSPDDEMRQAWIDEMVYAARRDIDRALLLSRLALEHPECNANYAPALEKDISALLEIRQIAEYSPLYKALHDFKQASPGRKRDAGPVGEEVKKLRTDAKGALEKIALREIELGVALKEMEALLPELHALSEIAMRTRELLDERKAELSALSYSDLEHRTLRALEDADTARELREKYDYIFVDEYQDTSDVQEALVSRICRGNNLFMVGDVKQSIYRFRQAEPRLFLEKYHNYSHGEGGTLLPLTMNFRSRPAILDFVNHIFERSMYGGDSEVVYDELARLNHGNKSLEGGSVDIHLLESPDADAADEAILEMKACEREALFISGEIRRMMAENPDLHYRDFAILTRTKRGVLGHMATILLQQGIPAYADGSEAFYDSVEIALALSLLKLTANRRSDIELIGVLRSPVVGLTADQLAHIRIARPDVPFADAAADYARDGDELAQQLQTFFGLLKKWQLLALCTDLGILTRTILDESGLYDCAGALPGGKQRQANLNQLVCNAAQFDQNVSGALTRFLKHTEKLKERGDGDDAHVLGENDDVVRLMTVHKSKGLEFPVVFGAMLSRRYNSRGGSELLSAHRSLGLGCLYCDPALQTRRKTLAQAAIAECTRREDRAEELRILYVLLTRARDSLVLVGSVKDHGSARARWNALKETPGAAGSYLDVIMPALDEEGSGLCSIHIHDSLTALQEEAVLPPEVPAAAPAAENDPLLRALLWTYPEEKATHQPLKLTVTGLLREIQSPDEQEPLIERPAFLTEDP
ncbi:MAG: UvrD-helicase domain-containing protein, partial [Clostridia bacterium]|nr:UvrD-helicase domain-containing protein [Clostridia bacterium]